MTVLKEPRLPKVGEVWVWKRNSKCNVIIKYVDSDGVYYKFNEGWSNSKVNIAAKTIQQFLETYLPPKPKPREVYVTVSSDYKYSDDPWGGAYPTELEARRACRNNMTVKKFREVLEDDDE